MKQLHAQIKDGWCDFRDFESMSAFKQEVKKGYILLINTATDS